MTVTISNLKSQLAKSREDVKVKLKDINDRTEEVKRRDDIIKLKEKEISDKSEQIKIMEDKITVKDNQLENLSAQILTKDNEIDSLNNQTKHDLEKITEMADKITVKDNQLEVLRAQISTKDNEIDSLNNQTKHNLETITKMTDELYSCRRRESCPTGRTNRIYKIYKPGISIFKAPCSSTGWMTILRRQGESVDFNRNWANYTNGFGNLAGDFFIGLEKLHQMTKDKPHELHIKLMKFNGKIAHAHYDNFQIGSEQELYKLISLGTYYGTAGDSLRYHEGTKFSTFDSDNDNKNNCAIITKGGWWYHNCGESYLTGSTNNLIWYHFGVCVFAEMMIKPRTV
nr:fibrinogen-like protein A [Drosophila suzukii]